MRFAYSLGIQLYFLLIQLASLFSSKAKKWLFGRKNLLGHLEEVLAKEKDIVWFHCASLGEFEQGRPLIEEYRKLHAKDTILLTFFSPSGYEIRKNYPIADFVFYLPLDSPGNARKFLDLLQPKLIFFIKYEFWYNYLNEIKKRKIPCFLISGIFRAEQIFFKFYGQWAFAHLHAFTHFFLQDRESANLLSEQGLTNFSISGDTRFDRVVKVLQESVDLVEIKDFKANELLLVSGSSWEAEDELLANFIAEVSVTVKILIASHEVSEKKSQALLQLFGDKAALWSQRKKEDLKNKKVLIIDSVGMLSAIYKYADIALIGGGFGKGVHNVLEAAVFGIPVLVGPNHSKFKEIKELLQSGAIVEINNQGEFNKTLLSLLTDEELRKRKGSIAGKYVLSHAGATKTILDFLGSKNH